MLSSVASRHSATPKRWCTDLLRPKSRFAVDLKGVPGSLKLPRGWSVHLGPQPDHLVYFVVSGAFEAALNGRRFPVGAGGLLWIQSGTRISFHLPEGQDCAISRFRLVVPRGHLMWPGGFLYLPDGWGCRSWMDRLVEEGAVSGPMASERIRGLLLCLTVEIARAMRTPTKQPGLDTAQARATIRFVQERAHQRVTPADVARHVGVSPDYYTRLFRATFGMPPRQWIVEQRIQMAAARLAESALPISEVAKEFGYDDVFLFSRQFKGVKGVSPRRFRAEQG